MSKILLGILIGLLMNLPPLNSAQLEHPPPLFGEPVEEQVYFRAIHRNMHNLPLVTSNPNTSRNGRRSDLVHANFSSSDRLCWNISTGPAGGTSWVCVTGSAP